MNMTVVTLDITSSILEPSTLLLLTVVFLLLLWWIHRRKHLPCLPPGPINWPLVGNLPTFLWHAFKAGSGLHELLTSHVLLARLSKTYGKIYILQVFGNYMIIISDQKLLKEALSNPKINDRSRNQVTKKIFGTNSMSYETFQPYRRFAMSTFRQFGVGKQLFEEKVSSESCELRNEISTLQGQPISLRELLTNATANVICSIVFGKRYNYNDGNFKQLMNFAHRCNDALGAGGSENALPILSSIPTNAKEDVDLFHSPISDLVSNIIEEHRNKFDSNHITDFVDAYLHMIKGQHHKNSEVPPDPKSFLTEDNMKGHLTALFIAGSDATSTAIHWGVLYLLANSDIQSRVQFELDSVVGRNRFPRISDKINLPYTRAVIQEVLRMASPVPLAVLHTVSEDTTIGPYNVPKGATVVPNIWAIHHDPQVWKDPDEFRPERFINSRDKVPEVIPFSVGRRSCPGEALAHVMVFIFLTHLLHQFKFRVPEGSAIPSLQGESGIVLKPTDFQACFVERDFN
ncbi:cytochrome P450 2U1-like [Amphiura filiformis]|uniref:cytochrome P450 2U1-like n=1 Tax=Amphiura filiformis TaxID=82378 RepID=UPI003B20FA57